MTRVIMLAGEAGSGKGAVASIIKEVHPTAKEWALADPFKWFAARVFDFTHHQLYGPSDARNALDPRYPPWSWDRGAGDWSVTAQRYAHQRVGFAADLTRWSRVIMQTAVSALDEWWSWVWNYNLHLTPRHVLQTLGSDMGRNLLSQDIWISALESRLKEASSDAIVIVSDGRFINEYSTAVNCRWEIWHLERAGAGLTGAAAEHESERDMHGQFLRQWRDRHFVNNGTLDELAETVREWLAHASDRT